MVHLIKLGMPLTSTMEASCVPFSRVSGNVLRHTRWMLNHSLYRERSDAASHAFSGGSGTSTETESFAIALRRGRRGCRRRSLRVRPVNGLLGGVLHLVDSALVLVARLGVDLVDRCVDLVGVLRQQALQRIYESHDPSLMGLASPLDPRATTCGARRASD